MLAKGRKNYYGYLFIAPFIIGFLVFGLYPVYNTIALSFTDTTLMKAHGSFIGLKNFERLFADSTFMTAVKNTWLLWTMNFIPQIGIAMLLSVWFTNTRLKIKGGGYLAHVLLPAQLDDAVCHRSPLLQPVFFLWTSESTISSIPSSP